MSDTSPKAGMLRELSPAKYELLLRARKARQQRSAAPASVPRPRPSGADTPLSYPQERLWFLDGLAPGDPVYNMPFAIELHGVLDVPTVERVLGALVERHETLRTTFGTVRGVPAQLVGPAAPVPVRVVDLRGTPEAGQEAETRRLAAEHAAAPFDLAAGPLIRMTLVRRADAHTVALLCLHHIISDDWSMGVLTEEFGQLYAAFRAGLPSPLAPLPVQYADYALWQRRELSGGELERGLDHWRSRLGGELPSLELPLDRPRPPAQTYAGRTHSVLLPEELVERTAELAKSSGSTMFMTLLATYTVLLHRYTGQDDIVVGTTVANRARPETQKLIGFLINILPLRADLSGAPTFRDVLRATRDMSLEAFAHQEVPFYKIVEEVLPDRDPSRSPLVETMFTLHNAPQGSLELPELRITTYPAPDKESSPFDLSLDVVEAGGRLRCDWEYNTGLFDAATVERMMTHFTRLLEAVVADPDQRIGELSMLSVEERDDVLTRDNEVTVTVGPHECVQGLFEEHVRRTPDAVAVVDAGVRVSYRELDRRAELIAARLRAHGVGPEVRVALCAPRSPDTIAALLGVLKAGGAYVPLDPANPVDRLNFVLDDAEARLLLTRRDVADQLPGLAPGTEVGYFDAWLDDTAAVEDTGPRSEPSAAHLAFIVYTSGSTGRAKGAMITQSALVSAFRSWERAYGLGTEVKTHLQAANVAFDVFTGDLVRALCSGGTLVLCPREILLDPERLHALLVEERVDFADLVPVVVRALASHVTARGGTLGNFKVLAVGADIWFMRDYWQLSALCPPGTRLVNSYGITESTVDSGLFETPMPDRADGEPVPIGRPLANTEFYVLDADRQPVPPGVRGTLHIGGLALARGYVARPGLTAERFVPHPFSTVPGSRLYDTGDVARLLPSGDVEVLGRADRQVKIRGFRIELEEIEAVLGHHPQVQDAAVVVVVDEHGERRLAGYVQPVPGTSPQVAGLQEYLRGRLPYYMVPATFTLLERMPLNANGKHDRKALPAPVVETAETAAPVAPVALGPVESAVAEIWESVLGADGLTAEDDFFDLGGHSMLVPQVVFALRQRFDIDVPLLSLFEATTIGQVARLVQDSQDAAVAGEDAAPDLLAEAELGPGITVDPGRTPLADPAAILLTGVTGFLGVHLLDGLLRSTTAVIHCLVRADDRASGLDRILACLDEHGLEAPADPARIVAEPGDLGEPLLGLGEVRFARLAEVIDAVHHSGAWVNFALPYGKLAPANVGGTREVLRLAGRAGGAPVHHISTASAPPAPGGGDGSAVPGGYNRSKWVAERLAVSARERGIPVQVYRPDYIGGHSRTGIGNPKDLIWAVIKGSIQLGSHPDLDQPVHLVPVDQVSDAIVRISLREAEDGGTGYDLGHPRPVSLADVFGWVREFGYDLRTLTYRDWLDELGKSAAESPDNALYPFLGLLESEAALVESEEPSSAALHDAYLDSSTPCPQLGPELLRTYLVHLAGRGFLPPVPAAGTAAHVQERS
ncbi:MULTISPECIES: non-ribosomal peptide synthetase [unclassified Streptomyces]|uniref:non-ribosomal peptide synthetase n=1 Tax=unclassified Streptomyces TaxID=2593676 RepID=UPI0009A0DA7E|nr:non-ribosomal peptide synthetase [Streptomyces sp. CB02058]